MELSEFYESFFEEAEELLADMEQSLLDVDIDNPDPEQLNAIFRAAHSIKGGAGAFGFTVLQETTHLLENLLDDARQGKMSLSREIVDVFLLSKDTLQGQVESYRASAEPDQRAFADICDRLRALAEHDSAAPAPVAPASTPTAPMTTTPKDEPLTRIAKVLQQIACEASGLDPETISSPQADRTATASGPDELEQEQHHLDVRFHKVKENDRALLLEELGHLGEVLGSSGDDSLFTVQLKTTEQADAIEAVMCFIIEADQLQIVPSAQQAAVPPATKVQHSAAKQGAEKDDRKSTESAQQSSIRVSVDKVDQIINLVGELIIIQSMLDQTASELDEGAQRALSNGLLQLQRTSRDLQESVMSVRMLPMDFVFSRYPRQVRDLAGKLGKEVELVMEGKSTELDKGLIEKITDPLTHLVRNSLDHGIETPAERTAAGKPARGTLTLSARHAGGNIVIDVADDGAGLNRGKLLAKAREKGIEVSDDMSDNEVWQLIFAPGFSTAAVVSDVSGRGVGMDVVRRNIQSLGGQVEIMSTPGAGTTTRIILPLTLAILDGMSLRVGQEMFVLPLGAVSELIQPTEEDIFTMAGDDILLKVRDEYLPVVALREVMDIPGAREVITECIAVIVHDDERSYALLVDEPVGQQQVVVKNLESNFRRVPGVSAATILGDGRVALILDPVGLHRCEHARRKFHASQAAGAGQNNFLWEVAPS